MDQSGNAEQVTRQNAALEGVADRVELHSADMRQLPFDDGSFDVVVSSLAIHNVAGADGRAAGAERSSPGAQEAFCSFHLFASLIMAAIASRIAFF